MRKIPFAACCRGRVSFLYVQRIRQLCRERSIAINKPTAMSGINQSAIDNIVRGLTRNPRAMTLHKIALSYGMILSEFPGFPELNDDSIDEQSDELHEVTFS